VHSPSAKTPDPGPEKLEGLLRELMRSPNVEVREGGKRMPELAGFQFEVRRSGSRTLLHLWSGERTLVRRVLRIAEESKGRLLLEVELFGRTKPARLELSARDAPPAEGRNERERFRARFEEILAGEFPDDSIESLTTSPDLEHSFSSCYVRGVQVRRGARAVRWAILGASETQGSAARDEALSVAILWLDWQRYRARKEHFSGLRLFLPPGATDETARRMRGLNSETRIELYELDERQRRVQRADEQDTGNRDSWLSQRRDIEETLAKARAGVEWMLSLAPDAIDLATVPGRRGVVSIRFRGLEFARWADGQLSCSFDTPEAADHATAINQALGELILMRHPKSAETSHPLYRAQPERWLETLVRAEVSRLDARLNPQHLYCQVPSSGEADRGVLDLLGVTRDGRLAVIELKATEDIHLPLQGLDYWLRVNEHLKTGSFHRYGYFPGIELQQAPPLLFLVAPGFRFHASAEVILKYFDPRVEVTRIGLNENWRSGPKVVFRQ